MFKWLASFIFLISLFTFPASVMAQTDTKFGAAVMPYPEPSAGNNFLGENQAYSVVFRGNGEAVVSARISFTNTASSPKSDFELRLPSNILANNLLAFQVIRDKTCIRYESPPVYIQSYVPVCVEYQEPDYFQIYGQNKYQKARVDLSGDTVKVTLPNPVDVNKSGSFFVYFRTMEFVHKNAFGAFNYDFETLKVNEAVQTLQLGLSTDSDLVLKGATGEVAYRFTDQSTAALAVPVAEKALTNSSIDSFYNQIGYGAINKTASSLAPLESFKASGSYAKSKFMLYEKEILIGLGVFVLTVIVLITIAKIISRKSQSISSNKSPMIPAIFVSLGFSILVGLYTGLLFFLLNQLDRINYLQYSQFIWIMIAVVSFAVYAFLVITPAVILGIKKGLTWGLTTFGMTIIWLFVLSVVIFGILFLANPPQNNIPTPYGVMEKSAPLPL